MAGSVSEVGFDHRLFPPSLSKLLKPTPDGLHNIILLTAPTREPESCRQRKCLARHNLSRCIVCSIILADQLLNLARPDSWIPVHRRTRC